MTGMKKLYQYQILAQPIFTGPEVVTADRWLPLSNFIPVKRYKATPHLYPHLFLHTVPIEAAFSLSSKRNATDFTIQTKNTSDFTPADKNTTDFTPASKNTTDFTATDKNSTDFTGISKNLTDWTDP